MKGQAEAFAVEAKGRAEAEQMIKKAEAFQQYKDGAMVDMLLEKLPLVRAASKMTHVFLGFFLHSTIWLCFSWVQNALSYFCSQNVESIESIFFFANWHFTLSISIPTFFPMVSSDLFASDFEIAICIIKKIFRPLITKNNVDNAPKW